MNPEIALIGVLSLVILFGLPLVKNRAAEGDSRADGRGAGRDVPLGMYFDLGAGAHATSFGGHELPRRARVPRQRAGQPVQRHHVSRLLRASRTATGLKYIVLFALIGSLESLLSAKAIEQIDPWRRKTNHDRDLLAVGVGNTLAAAGRRAADDLGDRPQQGQHRQRRPDALRQPVPRRCSCCCSSPSCPALIHQIPLAALAAMLVYTGFRLASPRSFAHMYHVGREQLVDLRGHHHRRAGHRPAGRHRHRHRGQGR